jgi:hypothetical protein
VSEGERGSVDAGERLEPGSQGCVEETAGVFHSEFSGQSSSKQTIMSTVVDREGKRSEVRLRLPSGIDKRT